MSSPTNPKMQAEASTRQRIRDFILQNLALPKGISSFKDDDPLMEIGVIDSLGIFRLVSFLEEDIQVRVEDHEINVQNLRSVETIERLVLSKRPALSGS